jgi:hypothetical protein
MPGACGVARKRYGAPPEVGMSSTHANSSGMDPTETEVRTLMKVLVGVDRHKTSLAVAAVDEALGELVERASFSQNSAGLRASNAGRNGCQGAVGRRRTPEPLPLLRQKPLDGAGTPATGGAPAPCGKDVVLGGGVAQREGQAQGSGTEREPPVLRQECRLCAGHRRLLHRLVGTIGPRIASGKLRVEQVLILEA